MTLTTRLLHPLLRHSVPSLSCRQTFMDFQRPNHLSREEALSLVSSFFMKEWKCLQVSDITVDRAQVGLNNEIYFVSRPATAGATEPVKLVIRKFSSIARDLDDAAVAKQSAGMWCSPMEETLTFMHMSRTGLGPRLYGIFDGGRIEEFIDCHNITHEEACMPEIEQEIASNLAMLHAADLPFKRPGYKFIDALRSIHGDAMEQLPFYEAFGDEAMLEIVQHDYGEQLEFLEPLLELDHHRLVFMHWDTHFGNIVVRNNPAGKPKTMILDYEISSYNMRGKDLGTFLISRSGFFPFPRPDRKLQSMQQFLPFLVAYRNQCASLFPDMDLNGEDSLDHLMRETLIGGMVSCLCYLLRFMYLFARKKGATPEARTLSAHMPNLLQGFNECKRAFLQSTSASNKP